MRFYLVIIINLQPQLKRLREEAKAGGGDRDADDDDDDKANKEKKKKQGGGWFGWWGGGGDDDKKDKEEGDVSLEDLGQDIDEKDDSKEARIVVFFLYVLPRRVRGS